jgi:hypothetical protein
MFDAKSKIVKIVGYAVIGFFGLIIVISFGMPDFISSISGDKSVAAIVNGKKIHAYDYYRFRDRYRKQLGKNFGKSKEIENIIFNNFVGEILLVQNAKDTGLKITEDRMMRIIKEMPDFKNPSTGKYDPERLKLILRQNNMSINELVKLLRKDILKRDYFKLIRMGIAVPSEDIKKEYMSENSRIKIRYAHLSSKEIEKRYGSTIKVSDAEIEKEMSSNLKEIKDPETDRERMRKKLLKKKLEDISDKLVEEINRIAKTSGSFESAAGILRGKTGISETFKIGERVKESGKKGKVLSDIGNSRIFRDTCLKIQKGASSEAIRSDRGIYIFTTIISDIKTEAPSDKDSDSLSNSITYKSFDTITNRLMTSLSEKGSVVKNLKTE